MLSIRIPKIDLDIEKIADSGQAFRFRRLSDGGWTAVSRDRAAAVYQTEAGLDIVCPEKDEAFWLDYFDADTDYSLFRRAADPKDGYLCRAVEEGAGIRILRQDPWETLISFIISQRKNIPAISASIEKLCLRFGEQISDDLYAFPEPSALAAADEESLKACSLGYRVPFIQKTARLVDGGAVDLAALNSCGDGELLERLMEFPGVGPKVANCVSLFAYHRIAAFPIDVWIRRVIDTEYGGTFPLERYEGFAGVLQQYIFYTARKDR